MNGSALQNTFIGMFAFENGKLLRDFAHRPLSHSFSPSCYLSLCPFLSSSSSLCLSIFVYVHQTIHILSFFAISLEEEMDLLLAP